MLIACGVAGAVGFVLLYWLILSVANRIGDVSALRERVARQGLNLWIWARPEPEPYEVAVYLLTTFATVGILAVVAARFARDTVRSSEPVDDRRGPLWPVMVGLVSVLAMLLGQYPDDLRTSYFWIANLLTGKRYLAAWLCAVALALVPYLTVRAGEMLQRQSIVWGSVLVGSFLLMYEPGHPLQILHDSGYLAPVHQVIYERTIYKDVASQYLFMGAYVLSFLKKGGLLAKDYHNFTFLLTVLWVVQLAITFAIIRRATRSDYWGSMCVFSTISISILSPWLSPVGIPNTGPLRWLGFFILILLMAFFGWRSRILIILLTLMIFIEIDSGIEAAVAYGFFRVIALCLNWREWRWAVKDMVLGGILMAVMFTLVQLFVVARTGQRLYFSEVFYSADRYAQLGFGMVPMPFDTYLYLLVAVNFVAIVFAGLAIRRDAIHLRRTRGGEYGHLLLFSACLALVAAVYYVGRSTDGNLYNVAQFTLIPLFLVVPIVLRGGTGYPRSTGPPALAVHLAISALLIALPIVNGKIYVGEKLVRKAKAGLSGLFRVEEVLSPYIDADVALIDRAFAKGEPVLWLGDDSGTFVLARTGHPFSLYFSPHRWALTTVDLRSSLDRLAARGAIPGKLVVECNDAVRYALARQAGIAFAKYDEDGRVVPAEAYHARRPDYDRLQSEAKLRCKRKDPPRYNAFLPNDLYQEKWNELFNFAEAAAAAFKVAYTLDVSRDCTGHNCVLVRE